MAVERDVTIATSSGEAISGVLCLPDGATSAPAVLLCQGLSGVAHLVLPQIAEGLAEHSYASLRFSYRGYGDSDGARGWIDPASRVDDASDALAWLAAAEGVDRSRIGIYGHSYGGPVAITVAAREFLAKAVVSTSGPGDGVDLLRACRPSWDWVALKHRLAAQRRAIVGGAAPTAVPLNEILPFSPAFEAAYAVLKQSQGGTTAQAAGEGLGTSRFYLASVDKMLDFRPSEAAARLGPTPLLMIHGEDDDTAPIETVFPVFRAATGPKRMIIIDGADHNDLDSVRISDVITACVAFYDASL